MGDTFRASTTGGSDIFNNAQEQFQTLARNILEFQGSQFGELNQRFQDSAEFESRVSRLSKQELTPVFGQTEAAVSNQLAESTSAAQQSALVNRIRSAQSARGTFGNPNAAVEESLAVHDLINRNRQAAIQQGQQFSQLAFGNTFGPLSQSRGIGLSQQDFFSMFGNQQNVQLERFGFRSAQQAANRQIGQNLIGAGLQAGGAAASFIE